MDICEASGNTSWLYDAICEAEGARMVDAWSLLRFDGGSISTIA